MGTLKNKRDAYEMLWNCHNCGEGSMSLKTKHCPECNHHSCGYCLPEWPDRSKQRQPSQQNRKQSEPTEYPSQTSSKYQYQKDLLPPALSAKNISPAPILTVSQDFTSANLAQARKSHEKGQSSHKPSVKQLSTSSNDLSSVSSVRYGELSCHFGKRKLENPNFSLDRKYVKCPWFGNTKLYRIQEHLEKHRSLPGQTDGINDEQWNLIKELTSAKGASRGLKGAQKEEHELRRWFEIWRMLFPLDPEPRSAYPPSLGAIPEAPFDTDGLAEIHKETLKNCLLSSEQMAQVLSAFRETMERACGGLGTVKVNLSSSQKSSKQFSSSHGLTKEERVKSTFIHQDRASTHQLIDNPAESQASTIKIIQDVHYQKIERSDSLMPPGVGCIDPSLLLLRPSELSQNSMTSDFNYPLSSSPTARIQARDLGINHSSYFQANSFPQPHTLVDTNLHDTYATPDVFSFERINSSPGYVNFDYSAPSFGLYPQDSFQSSQSDNTDLNAILEQEFSSDTRDPLETPSDRNRGLQRMNWGNLDLVPSFIQD